MHYLDCIDFFNLQDEVRKFVYKRVKEKIGEVNQFSFEGYYTPCKDISPHPPHKTGFYETERYGELDKFCLGRDGILPDGNEIIINTEEFLSGTLMFLH